MTGRRGRLLALLWTLNDLLPATHGSLNPTRGVVPGQWQACGNCNATGFVLDKFKREVPCSMCSQACPDCDGTGYDPARDRPCRSCRTTGDVSTGRVWAKGHRGELHVDGYTSDQVGSTEAGTVTKPPCMVKCDACEGSGVGGAHLRDLDDPLSEYREPCRYCSGSGKRAVALFDLLLDQERSDEGTALEAAIDRRRDAGSYHELDEALAILPQRWRTLVGEVHRERTRPEQSLSGTEQVILEASLRALEFLMPDTIKVPPAVRAAVKHAEERAGKTLAIGKGAGKQLAEKRDKEIRKHARHERPTQWIAAEYGLSVATVNRIVAGDSASA